MTLRFCKTTSDEAMLMQRNLMNRTNTITARNFIKKMLKPEPHTIEFYRQAGRELAWRAR